MKSVCADEHIHTKNTNLPKVHTYRNTHIIYVCLPITYNVHRDACREGEGKI